MEKTSLNRLARTRAIKLSFQTLKAWMLSQIYELLDLSLVVPISGLGLFIECATELVKMLALKLFS